MEEVKINLSSKIIKGFVTKLITKAIKEKLGYKVDIQINALTASVVDGQAHIHIDVDGDVDKENFIKAIVKLGLD